MDKKAAVNTQTDTQSKQPSINYGRTVEVEPIRIVERIVPKNLDAETLRKLIIEDQQKKSK